MHRKLTATLVSLIDMLNLTRSGFQLASAQSAACLKRGEANYVLG